MFKYLICLLSILSVFTTSFATFTVTSGRVTQSGTDTDLSGLKGKVESYSVGSDDAEYTVYNIGERSLKVDGQLTIDPEKETILIYESKLNNSIWVTDGAILNIGVEHTEASGYVNQSKGTAIKIIGSKVNSIRIMNNASLNIFGASIYICDDIVFNKDCNVVFRNAHIYSNESDVEINQASSNLNIDGLELNNVELNLKKKPLSMKNLFLHSNDAGMRMAVKTAQTILEGVRFEGLSNAIDNTIGTDVKMVNLNSGTSGLNISTGSSNDIIYSQVVQRWMLAANSDKGTDIANARYYIVDSNPIGRSLPITINGENLNLNKQIVYSQETNLAGVTPVSELLVGASLSDGWNYRSLGRNDMFDIHIWSYGYEYKIINDILMRDDEDKLVFATLYDDVNISDTRANVANYSGIDVDHDLKMITITEDHSLNELYDFLKYNKSLKANIIKPEIDKLCVSVTNVTLDFDAYNFIIDGCKLSNSSKFLNAITTGDIDFKNGGVIDFFFRYKGIKNSLLSIVGVASTDVIEIVDPATSTVLATINGNGVFNYDHDISKTVYLKITCVNGSEAQIEYILQPGFDNEKNLNINTSFFTANDGSVLYSLSDSLASKLNRADGLLQKLKNEQIEILKSIQK